MIVAGTIDVAAAIIAESSLSFLGLGFPPDIPTWGRILFDAKDNLDFAPHWAIFPGTAIFLTVLSINYIGDGLRDALDPRKVLASKFDTQAAAPRLGGQTRREANHSGGDRVTDRISASSPPPSSCACTRPARRRRSR